MSIEEAYLKKCQAERAVRQAAEEYSGAVKENARLTKKESNVEYCRRHYFDAERLAEKTKEQLAAARSKWELNKTEQTEAAHLVALGDDMWAEQRVEHWEARLKRREQEEKDGSGDDDDEDQDEDA